MAEKLDFRLPEKQPKCSATGLLIVLLLLILVALASANLFVALAGKKPAPVLVGNLTAEQARELAKKAAERWAAAVRAKKQPLAAVLAGKPGVGPVYQTEPFSWLTYGGLPAWLAQRPPMLSQIKARVKDPVSGLIEEKDAVDMPGQNFMRAVFNLRPGEVGVAMNQPETYVYVVQVTETAPSAEVLWRTFVKENDNTYMWTGQTDQFAAIRAWLAEMQSAAGLKWERPIQQTRGGGE